MAETAETIADKLRVCQQFLANITVQPPEEDYNKFNDYVDEIDEWFQETTISQTARLLWDFKEEFLACNRTRKNSDGLQTAYGKAQAVTAKLLRWLKKQQPQTVSQETVNPTNSLLYKGSWILTYGGEEGTWKHQKGSGFLHLARLLSQPGKCIKASEFFPPPTTGVKQDVEELKTSSFGRDDAIDNEGLRNIEEQMELLKDEIKELANDPKQKQLLEKKQKEFSKLAEIMDRHRLATGSGHRPKCGVDSWEAKASHNLYVRMAATYKRIAKMAPEAAEHFTKHIVKNDNSGEWAYLPPPDCPPWQVTPLSEIPPDKK